MSSGEVSEYRKQGKSFFEQQRYQDAIAMYLKAVTEKCDDISVMHYNISVCYDKLFEYSNALQHCMQAIESNPHIVKYYYLKALILFHQSNFLESVRAMRFIHYDDIKIEQESVDKFLELEKCVRLQFKEHIQKKVKRLPLQDLLKDQKKMSSSCEDSIRFACEKIGAKTEMLRTVCVIGGGIELQPHNISEFVSNLCTNLNMLHCVDKNFLEKPTKKRHLGTEKCYYRVICHSGCTFKESLTCNCAKAPMEVAIDLCIVINPDYNRHLESWVGVFRKLIDKNIQTIVLGHSMDCSLIEIEDILCELNAFLVVPTQLNPHTLHIKNSHITVFRGQMQGNAEANANNFCNDYKKMICEKGDKCENTDSKYPEQVQHDTEKIVPKREVTRESLQTRGFHFIDEQTNKKRK
ncbi:hypothetical protein RFI_27685 [Reticulomyxa filosa]|uniref:RING-type E3 ubiquitin transferase n=1 Tax=Reticulomyxa filosa TaxID=46433 RepID=X6M6S4_RETFI|nr:hypothetical protein RFI_27685 [Reticulomyxa filosa]|eukprot:ETO09693.1 hypothetical protein RFI_27685 [Reticulomyxa filosa]